MVCVTPLDPDADPEPEAAHAAVVDGSPEPAVTVALASEVLVPLTVVVVTGAVTPLTSAVDVVPVELVSVVVFVIAVESSLEPFVGLETVMVVVSGVDAAELGAATEESLGPVTVAVVALSGPVTVDESVDAVLEVEVEVDVDVEVDGSSEAEKNWYCWFVACGVAGGGVVDGPVVVGADESVVVVVEACCSGVAGAAVDGSATGVPTLSLTTGTLSNGSAGALVLFFGCATCMCVSLTTGT